MVERLCGSKPSDPANADSPNSASVVMTLLPIGAPASRWPFVQLELVKKVTVGLLDGAPL